MFTGVTMEDVWNEWRVDIQLTGLPKSALGDLEKNKNVVQYKNPRDRGLKSAITIRRHIVKYIDECIAEHR